MKTFILFLIIAFIVFINYFSWTTLCSYVLLIIMYLHHEGDLGRRLYTDLIIVTLGIWGLFYIGLSYNLAFFYLGLYILWEFKVKYYDNKRTDEYRVGWIKFGTIRNKINKEYQHYKEDIFSEKTRQFINDLTSEERDNLICVLSSFGIAFVNRVSNSSREELETINKINENIYNRNLPKLLVKKVSIIKQKSNSYPFNKLLNEFIKGKDEYYTSKVVDVINVSLYLLIKSDGKIDNHEIIFKNEWNLNSKKIINQYVEKPNVLIVGGTGVGKSSLINLVLDKELAKVGDGKPITKEITPYGDYINDKIKIYDTEGFELDNEEYFYKVISEFMDTQQQKDIKNRIHVVWHIISSSSNRVTDFDLKIKQYVKGYNLPVAEILTKADTVNEDDLKPMVEQIYGFTSFEKAFQSSNSPFFVTNKKKYAIKEHNINIDKAMSWTYSQIQ